MAGSVFNHLIRPNAKVRIEAISTPAEGESCGSVEAFTVVADDVPVLVSGVKSTRDGRFESRTCVLTGTASGDHPALGRADTRIYFHANSASVPAGTYAEVVSATPHGAANNRLLSHRYYTIAWSEVPAGPAAG